MNIKRTLVIEGSESGEDEDYNDEDKRLYGEGGGTVPDSEDRNGGEDEGSRFSGETKVVDTFEGEYGSSNEEVYGEYKDSRGDDSEKSKKNGGGIDNEEVDKSIEEINEEGNKSSEMHKDVSNLSGENMGNIRGNEDINFVNNETDNIGGLELGSNKEGTNGLEIKEDGNIKGINKTGPSARCVGHNEYKGLIKKRMVYNRQQVSQEGIKVDVEKNEELAQDSLTTKRDKREVFPSCSTGSGRARKNGTEELGESKKGASDAYKEYQEVGNVNNGIFHFGSGKKDEDASGRCHVSIEQVKEIREKIGVSWVRGEEEDMEKESGQEENQAGRTAEMKCGVVDDVWIEDIWGGQGYGYSQLSANENSGGIIDIWDTRIFVFNEAVEDERFIAVKGSWKGKNEEVFLVCVNGPHEMMEFNEFINNTRLIEIPMGGRKFTRISNDGMKFSKLDIFLLNDKFNELWGNLLVVALDRKLSDHCLIVIKDVELDFGPKPFRVFNIWLKEPDFFRVVEKAWKKKAEKWALNENERCSWMEARKQWEDKEREYGNMLRQKSKIKWDVEDDENSKFFHSYVRRRNNKCSLRGLIVNGLCKIKKISMEEAYKLEKEFNEKEVWEAICGCGGDKAPGPDGFNFKFIKKYGRSASMSILVNGSPSEEFGLVRGVRQGDPLSSFLFILAAKGLNAIVFEAVEKGIFRGVVRWGYDGMARWMGCGIGEFPLTYLGLPIGENMRWINAWGPVVEKFINKLADWKAKTMSFGGHLTLVKSVLGSFPLALGGVGMGSGVWIDILRGGIEIDGMGLDFSSFCLGVLGNGRDIRFWVDRWVDNRRLCDRFPRLYHLDRRNEGCIWDKGSWFNDVWCWKWEWVRSIRGRVSRDFEELLCVVRNIVVCSNCRDKWRWVLREDDDFTVKRSCNICSTGYDSILSQYDPYLLVNLNESQRAAITVALCKTQCCHVSTVEQIWGPPGTGKTMTVSVFLFILLQMYRRTLVCAPTDVAIIQLASCVLRLVRESCKITTASGDYFYPVGDVV
nr:UvrD-like helicase, ATP-binding domain, P-loop containing nucleoside triphosphate hydrolase [Tanacetum cinerariifolium]